MHDGDINYSNYGLRELHEALSAINREKYPKNYSNLCAAYQRVTGKSPEIDVQESGDAASVENELRIKPSPENGFHRQSNTTDKKHLVSYPAHGVLTKKLSTWQSGAIFGALSVAPMLLLFFVPNEVTRANFGSMWVLVFLGILSALVTGALFSLGTSLARRRHHWISIAFSTALFFAMSFSIGSLLGYVYPDGGPLVDLIFYVLLGFYTVAAGWRFAPKEDVEGTDAPRT